jgi:hypothetical protein
MTWQSPLWRGRPGCRGAGRAAGANDGREPDGARRPFPSGLEHQHRRPWGRRPGQGWRIQAALPPILGLALLLFSLAGAPAQVLAAVSESAATTRPAPSITNRYRCEGDLLLARSENGAVDALAIPNLSAGTPPGAFVVLQWRGSTLQLPRTNNAGPPSYTDGRWWWSLENPDRPRFRMRRGTIQEFTCIREP